MSVHNNGDIIKLKLKINGTEIEYEGNETFLKSHVFEVFERTLSSNPKGDEPEDDVAVPDTPPKREAHHLTTNSIASILKVDSGPELIIAAAAHLHFKQGKPSYTRSNLRDEMRNATSFYKTSYSSNLSSYMARLVKNEDLHEIAHETYALPEGKLQGLKTQLDEHR